MSNRNDGDLLVAVSFRIRMVNGQNNGAGPILSPFDLTSLLFFLPEVGVGNDEADFRFWKSGHTRSQPPIALFRLLVQKRVEVVVGRIHLGTLDRLGDICRQVLDPMHATLESTKPL